MTHPFPIALKDWRARRRLSQLQLASTAEVSARHLAFLETGRARPSRGMVLRLAQALDLPHAAANGFLAAAGFAPHYPVLGWDAPEMAPLRAAAERMLATHAPYPGLVADQLWRIVRLNPPAARLFGAIGLAEGDSLLDLAHAPDRIMTAVENGAEVARHMVSRLRADSAAGGGLPALDAAATVLAAWPGVASPPAAPAGPVTPTVFRLPGGGRLSLFQVLAQFGSAEEVSLPGLKLELMFPADDDARRFLEAAGGA
jgi:transcriptional regulator with XRE-family HTH domain